MEGRADRNASSRWWASTRTLSGAGEVGTGEALTPVCTHFDHTLRREGGGEVDRFAEGGEYKPSLGGVWQGAVELSVESAGAQEGRVDELWSVGGGQDEDAVERLDAVELTEQLVDHSIGHAWGGGGRLGMNCHELVRQVFFAG
ncbi:MAG: hypothetical protein SGPRY_012841 [Prymnesium sp.]